MRIIIIFHVQYTRMMRTLSFIYLINFTHILFGQPFKNSQFGQILCWIWRNERNLEVEVQLQSNNRLGVWTLFQFTFKTVFSWDYFSSNLMCYTGSHCIACGRHHAALRWNNQILWRIIMKQVNKSMIFHFFRVIVHCLSLSQTL